MVEPGADVLDDLAPRAGPSAVGRGGLRTRDEELCRGPRCERGDGIDPFAGEVEHDAAGNQQLQARRRLEQLDEQRACIGEMLGVVDHQQELLRAYEAVEGLPRLRRLDSQRGRDLRGHQRGVTRRRELDEDDAVRELVDESARQLQREARLPGAART